MRVQVCSLRDDDPQVKLQAYILDDSPEFWKIKPRPAVVICPGGAYLGTSDREAEPVALRFAALGFHAFVLRYTTFFAEWPSDWANLPEPRAGSAYPRPLYDLAKAMSTVREHASEWDVDPDRIAVVGFSAGGHLAGSLGVGWHERFLSDALGEANERFRPNALILGYPLLDYSATKLELESRGDDTKLGLWQLFNQAAFGQPNPTDEQLERFSPVHGVSERTPPAFIWHTADDDLVFAVNALNFASALAARQVPFELHVFESGVHGLSLADAASAGEPAHVNPDVAAWFDLAARWLNKRFG
ncbi:alpha/beta hydrolase [Paenibacillaceae bacterium WGS1546]|uniref:alpha/beta hydrolase n=1 Tax=Cohnella sp. WGS1546 TaxID=3366810 RepID=UPI00372CFDAD